MAPGPASLRGRVRAALLPILLLLPACGPLPAPPGGADGLGALGRNAPAWTERGRDASLAFATGDWEEATRILEERIALYPAPGEEGLGERLEAALQVDFYNLACARAMAGATVPALDALEQAVGEGYGVVGFDHLVEDPDLDSLRGEPRYRALVERLSWNVEVAVGGPVRGGRLSSPLLVVLRGDGVPSSASAVAPEGPGESFAVAVPDPPYRVTRTGRAWTTDLDPGNRAARKAAYAAELASSRLSVDRGRVVLLAPEEGLSRLAWEILLRDPGPFTHAVVRGPAPPAWAVLDRGAEGLKVEVFVVGEGSAPPPPLAAERVPSVEEALRRILR